MSENLIEVLDAVGEKLKENKNTIYFQSMQIAELKKALESAEKTIKELTKPHREGDCNE